jgi:hypothetical protein
MLANMSAGHNTNTNILETIQAFTGAWKMFISATMVECLHKTNIWQQEKCEIENDNDVNVNMVKNWQK